MFRRVLWLIEQWTGAKPPNNIITTLYEFITSSLERSLDIAVRLSAASALRQVLDDFDFDIGKILQVNIECFNFVNCFVPQTVEYVEKV